MRGPRPGALRPAMRPLTRAVIAVVLLAGCAAQAADKPREATFGKGTGAGAYLSREQLRACLNQRARMALEDADLLKEQAALSGVQAVIASRGDALKEQLVSLDRTSAEAVAAYNGEAQTRDKMIDDYEAGVTQHNSRVEAGKTEREAFAKTCDNRRYFEDDETAIKKGR